MMNAQSAPQRKPTASPQSLASADPYGPKPQSAVPYGNSPPMPSAHHQSSYASPYGGSPALVHGGHGINAPGRMPPGPNHPNAGPPPQLGYHRPPWPSYSLPAMPGPIMTNVHNPNSPMSLVGGLQPGFLAGFNSGHVASMQQMYGGHPPLTGHAQPSPANDRPFKCDQCPQSFNRNHDLKRHKRIHLSIKPFPCAHCDKSFSRKDALKRHILVKGCGKGNPTDGGDANTNSTKPADENANPAAKDKENSDDGSSIATGGN